MQIIRADTLGFCPGVRMAVQAAEQAVQNNPGTPVFILGQIVHNPRVSSRLAGMGAVELPGDDGSAAPPGSLVVVRSHGASPQTLDKLKDAGVRVIDATCPKVAANQRAAADFARRGYTVVIAGDRGHGETLGVAGHAPGSVIVSNPDQARTVGLIGPIALVSQTTMSEDEYAAIREALRERFPDLADRGGICEATGDRRVALERLCTRVDAVVVVGGRNSANTRRLAEYARSLGKPAWHVQTADEIPIELAAYETVGLTAGASTPADDVDDAERRLLAL
ncbi:MAG: 4-hydroxy-3-methylbut-2-enyl diphosphate reductase [Spirochaetales bacterium]|nr:MAG: 4-hydroxy-3-methylbut-2-enyl diphosphate reductase [Spirochaetales bacterium]